MARAEGVIPIDRAMQHVEVLRDLSHRLAHPLDLHELLRVLHDETSRIVDTTIFILGLYDEASQTVDIIGQIFSGIEHPGGSFPLGSGFTSQAIRNRESLLIKEWSRSGPRVQVQYATDRPSLPESGMTVPLIYDDQVLGVLLCQSYEPDAYDEQDLLTFEAIAGQVARAIESMRCSERLDAQLRRRVTELETILAAMSDALLIVDSEGCVIRLNRSARKLLQLDSSSLVLGQPLDRDQGGRWPLGAREIADALGPLIDALRAGETIDDVEVACQLGERRILSFSGSPLRDSDGRLNGGVIVFRDVTERRVIEQLKDEILAMASHDLKTPITAIKTQTQLLERQVAAGRVASDGLARGLATIVRQSDRLVALLNTILDLSRIEAGRLQLHPRRMDLVALIEEVVQDVQATTTRHRLRVRAPQRVDGTWDEVRLQQVLQNLLGNAVKYSPDGGSIEVEVAERAHQVTVCIRDPGIGVTPEDVARLFERFYRAGETRRIEGAGLGLYICHGIVAAHGGRIWAESEGPSRGSRFCFTLPAIAPR